MPTLSDESSRLNYFHILILQYGILGRFFTSLVNLAEMISFCELLTTQRRRLLRSCRFHLRSLAKYQLCPHLNTTIHYSPTTHTTLFATFPYYLVVSCVLFSFESNFGCTQLYFCSNHPRKHLGNFLLNRSLLSLFFNLVHNSGCPRKSRDIQAFGNFILQLICNFSLSRCCGLYKFEKEDIFVHNGCVCCRPTNS